MFEVLFIFLLILLVIILCLCISILRTLDSYIDLILHIDKQLKLLIRFNNRRVKKCAKNS